MHTKPGVAASDDAIFKEWMKQKLNIFSRLRLRMAPLGVFPSSSPLPSLSRLTEEEEEEVGAAAEQPTQEAKKRDTIPDDEPVSWDTQNCGPGVAGVKSCATCSQIEKGEPLRAKRFGEGERESEGI
jgi:hypothetical protein